MSRVSQPLQPTPPGDMHSSPGVSSGTCGEAESGTQKTSSRPGERHRNEPQEDAEPCWQGAARSNGNSFDGTRHLSRTRWAELSPSGGKLRLREVACLLASGPRSSPRIPIISSFRGVVGREARGGSSHAGLGMPLWRKQDLLPSLYLLVAYHGEGNGTPLQYSCLENPMDGGAW